MVKPELGFFQMKQKHALAETVEFQHSSLSERPKAFDSIYVPGFVREFVDMMINTKMFLKTEIDKTVIADPTVGMNDGVETDLTPNNSLQGTFLAVRNDLCIDPVTSFEYAKNDRLVAGSASAFSRYSSSAKVRLVNLDLTGLDGGVTFAFHKQPDPYFLKDQVHTFSRYTGQLARFCRRQIHRKVSYYLTKFLLCDSGTAIIPVNLLHVSSLAPM